ncbi:EAL domain-containing protein [Geodermatophilus sp. URMC 65]
MALAHDLGLTLVAEGVEDTGTQAALAALGCDAAQGYGIARPCPSRRSSAGSRPRSRSRCSRCNGSPQPSWGATSAATRSRWSRSARSRTCR